MCVCVRMMSREYMATAFLVLTVFATVVDKQSRHADSGVKVSLPLSACPSPPAVLNRMCTGLVLEREVAPPRGLVRRRLSWIGVAHFVRGMAQRPLWALEGRFFCVC